MSYDTIMKSLGKTAVDFPVALFELDSMGCILSVNAFWQKLTGLHANEVLQKPWFDLVLSSEQPELESKWRSFCSQPEGHFEAFFTPKLTQPNVDFLLVKISHSAQGFLACLENRTELKQANQSNHHLREKIIALFRNSNQMIIMLDRKHRVTEFNHVAAISARQRFFREMEAGEDFINYVQPDRLDDFYSSFEQALTGQHVFKERIIHAPDGQAVSYEMSYSPIRDEQNQICGVCFTGLNIEAQKQMQVLLHHEQLFVSAILDTSSALILVLDQKGRIIRFNQACEKLSGYTFHEVQGKHFGFLLPKSERESYLKRFDDLQVKDFPISTQMPLVTRQAEIRSISWTGTVLLNVEGTVEYHVATGIDITESEKTSKALREHEEMLRQIQKLDAIGQLTGEIAHDFNNILAGIQGYAQLIEESLASGTVAAEHVHEIQRICEKARALTGQLLIFSRKHRPNPRPLNIEKLLLEMNPLFLPLLGENLQLHTDCAPNLPQILMEPTHLEQLVMNLVVNARDAMDKQGEIFIKTFLKDEKREIFVPLFGNRPAGKYLCISVKDQGTGIPVEIQEKIFAPFFTTKAEGTGLGLAIIYGIVTEYGGYILLNSSPQTGTCFEIYLPAMLSTPLSPASSSNLLILGLFEKDLESLENSLGPEYTYSALEIPQTAPPSGQRMISRLTVENIEKIHNWAKQARTPPQVLYLSGTEEQELALLPQLKPWEDILICPMDSFRLNKWLQA